MQRRLSQGTSVTLKKGLTISGGVRLSFTETASIKLRQRCRRFFEAADLLFEPLHRVFAHGLHHPFLRPPPPRLPHPQPFIDEPLGAGHDVTGNFVIFHSVLHLSARRFERLASVMHLGSRRAWFKKTARPHIRGKGRGGKKLVSLPTGPRPAPSFGSASGAWRASCRAAPVS